MTAKMAAVATAGIKVDHARISKEDFIDAEGGALYKEPRILSNLIVFGIYVEFVIPPFQRCRLLHICSIFHGSVLYIIVQPNIPVCTKYEQVFVLKWLVALVVLSFFRRSLLNRHITGKSLS